VDVIAAADRVELRITDDGIGSSPASAPDAPGLRSIDERVRLVRGSQR